MNIHIAFSPSPLSEYPPIIEFQEIKSGFLILEKTLQAERVSLQLQYISSSELCRGKSTCVPDIRTWACTILPAEDHVPKPGRSLQEASDGHSVWLEVHVLQSAEQPETMFGWGILSNRFWVSPKDPQRAYMARRMLLCNSGDSVSVHGEVMRSAWSRRASRRDFVAAHLGMRCALVNGGGGIKSHLFFGC
ncbi:pyridoxal-5'-phosphate-dependent enzyme family protein [Striga asiatica]|uniref:Pyridoxal-5'-phosphate-dependent enzyme family protein n=1 Tax=Striga asiatica TaxID=4170 RepID=A0A5A7PT54_STRAF|nr:pyridoxal-5'-phosphate-dependent enzyme family protein [Striga asiatica]